MEAANILRDTFLAVIEAGCAGANTGKNEVVRRVLRGVCTDWMRCMEEGIIIVAAVRN